LLAAIAFILLHGDREFDWLDLVFSELHLGATYDAIIRRRLWRRLPVDVVLTPLIILALTYLLAWTDQSLLITTITIYAAIWHRGRQNLGVARFYQRQAGGPLSPAHRGLFSAAIYAPMGAALLLYNHLAPDQYEGDPYYPVTIGTVVAWGAGLIALACVLAYVIWTWRCRQQSQSLHPGEFWVVLAHAVAFGSCYVLGATHASFIFVLSVHHEVQYLYFTYAVARWPFGGGKKQQVPSGRFRSEIRFAAVYALWPVLGLAGALSSHWFQLEWLAPLGVGGLFCHYWLDGRIWTRRAMVY
jgi:hypothetical protein